MQTSNARHFVTAGLVILAVAGGFACKKRQDQAKPTPSVSEIFEIQDADQFSNDLGYRLVTWAYDHGFKSLNPSEQVVAAIWELEAEVNNGGFDQYFLNSAGDHSAEALSALETIGARRTAELLRRAQSAFPKGRPSPNREKRQKQREALPPSAETLWSELDETFYENPESLAPLVQEYARKNRHAFK